MKLRITIVAENDFPMDLLKLLAKEKFNAKEINYVESTDTLNIDAGMNDIRAKIDKLDIQFYIRYERDETRYEKLILDFCRDHALALRFG